MGRRKLEIKKIENPTNRQVTYSKRRNGLMKKARELSVLCDIDIAVIAFSPAGKLTEFCKDDSSIENVITRYANIPQHERTKGRFGTVEYLNKVAQNLTDERGLEAPRVGYADLQLEVQQLKSQLKRTVVERNVSEQKARHFASNEFINSLNSPAQLSSVRSELVRGLKNVQERIGQLDRQLRGSGGGPNTVQQTSFEMMTGLPARAGSNVGHTADSAQAMPMHKWGGVHNLDNATSIMANSQMKGQLPDGDMDYSFYGSSLHHHPQHASPTWNHHHQGPM